MKPAPVLGLGAAVLVAGVLGLTLHDGGRARPDPRPGGTVHAAFGPQAATGSPAQRFGAEDTGLLSLRASALALQGDDEGAEAAWAQLTQTPAVLVDRARHAATLELHARAAELALAAVQALEAEGEARRDERDRALALALSEQLHAGALDAVQARLETLLAGPQEERELAPFLVVRARLALLRGAPAEAPADLRRALAADSGAPAVADASLLLAWALLQSGQLDDARALLDQQPASLAQQLLLARVLTARLPESALVRETLPRLSPDAWSAADDSLARLRALVGPALPSLAFTALEAGLADAQRLRERGDDAGAGTALAAAARDALRWQALEAATALPVPAPDAAAFAAQGAWVDRWVERQQAAGRALLVVLPGEERSQLLLGTREHGVSTYALPGRRALHELELACVEALRNSDLRHVAGAAHALYAALLPPGAQSELTSATHWTVLLPPELAAVPPPMWVTAPPADGRPVAWLVNDHVVALRPHAATPPNATPAGAAAPAAAAPAPAAAATGAAVAAHGKPPPVGWFSLGAPALDRARLPFVTEQWLARFGEQVFAPAPAKRVQPGIALAGADATAPALRDALAWTVGLQLSLPGAGGGRLGGLLLAPGAGAPFADEAAGFLPWHRLAELPLPPRVILDNTRFDPADVEHGPGWAASALLRHAQEVLFTRWPMPAAVRDAMIGHLQVQFTMGRPLPDALAEVQRGWLDAARVSGDVTGQHPRLWAAWLPWGGP